jgi:hypothetical protein
MNKVIAVLIVAAFLYGIYQLFFYYERVKNEEAEQQQKAATALVVGETLEGVPQPLHASLQAAQQKGANGLREWLKNYGHAIQDPRKAWIELDYVVMIARDQPVEARRLFKNVKDRTPPSSPVWPRINQMSATYE